MSSDHLPSSDLAVERKPIAPPDAEWRPNKGARVDDAASMIMGDSLIILYKKFFIPNNVVTTVLKRYDRAGLPLPKYLTICVTSLRAGFYFPPPAELIEISKICGVSLSVMSVMVGLTALFRDRRAVLTPKHLL
ncbi:hypothetical protein IEQ34_000097 [Dendrobium chrysotoxum]|uniref:Uncharacterized protein n=1 Tax=Dendrobium chrysotoxum TaxID=161865 RepID=A0AAV7HRG8_DENCH|nr:hypothetical protein IEQ34_000097 [Dendrobium chrysotoxum]